MDLTLTLSITLSHTLTLTLTLSDYIHVMDLADAHVAALRRLSSSPPDYGCKAINVGTGRGSTVLEMVEAFKKVTGADVPYKFAPRRPGDSEAVWAATGEGVGWDEWWCGLQWWEGLVLGTKGACAGGARVVTCVCHL